jgi:hypothetical protein
MMNKNWEKTDMTIKLSYFLTILFFLIQVVFLAEPTYGQDESDFYSKWLSNKLDVWQRIGYSNRPWDDDGSPWAPFDMSRNFLESDFIVQCVTLGATPRNSENELTFPLLLNKLGTAHIFEKQLKRPFPIWRNERLLKSSLL